MFCAFWLRQIKESVLCVRLFGVLHIFWFVLFVLVGRFDLHFDCSVYEYQIWRCVFIVKSQIVCQTFREYNTHKRREEKKKKLCNECCVHVHQVNHFLFGCNQCEFSALLVVCWLRDNNQISVNSRVYRKRGILISISRVYLRKKWWLRTELLMRQKGTFNREVFFLLSNCVWHLLQLFFLSFYSIDSMSKNKRLMVSMHQCLFSQMH